MQDNTKIRFLSKKHLVFGLFPVLAWMLIIFCFSAQDGKDSAHLSAGFVLYVVDMLFALADWCNISFTNLSASSLTHYVHCFVRKLAHFGIYSVLGFLLLRYFLQHKNFKIAAVFTLFSGVLYAMFDEYHQTFVAGRGGAILDVFIDASGVVCGIILFFLFTAYKRRKIFNKKD